jgi:hypothetical protein
MLYKFRVLVSVTAAVCILSACAQAKKSQGLKSGTTYAKVLQATVQRTVPGVQGIEPVEEIRIVITWTSSEKPETFFWRGEGNWFTCNIGKVSKTAPMTKDPWYTLSEVNPDKIKKNDTLELMPVAGGKFPVPSVIPSSATNTIYFKTKKNTTWLSLPVKNITRKKTIVMP